jgi:hypothetical protein
VSVRAKALAAVAILLFCAYTVQVRHANLAPEHSHKVIRLCDRVTWTVPAEDARQIKRGAEKDCGIFPPKHPRRAGPVGPV